MENETSNSGFIDPTSPDETSSQFSGYVEIPSEGFNSLYKAKRNGRLYVLKGLKAEYRNDATYKTLLKKEFDIEIQLNHPNIVSVHSLEDDLVAGPCIVMDFVDGCTLREFLKTSPKKEVRLAVVKELLSAMDYYHSLQVIHRDLKPDNILITRNGNHARLIDFGLGDTDYHTVMKQPAGSDKYAAPEQKDSSVAIDCRADIYAFGKILQQVFPDKYGKIVEKCTKENRDERYNNADEILSDIDKSKTRWIAIVTALATIVAVVAYLTINALAPHPNNDNTAKATPSANDEKALLQTLHDSIEQVSALYRHKFDSAMAAGDNKKYKEWASMHHSVLFSLWMDDGGTILQNNYHKLSLEGRTNLANILIDINGKYWDDIDNIMSLPSRADELEQLLESAPQSQRDSLFKIWNSFWDMQHSGKFKDSLMNIYTNGAYKSMDEFSQHIQEETLKRAQQNTGL